MNTESKFYNLGSSHRTLPLWILGLVVAEESFLTLACPSGPGLLIWALGSGSVYNRTDFPHQSFALFSVFLMLQKTWAQYGESVLCFNPGELSWLGVAWEELEASCADPETGLFNGIHWHTYLMIIRTYYCSHLCGGDSRLCSSNACMICVSEGYWINGTEKGASAHMFPPGDMDIWFWICFPFPPVSSHLGFALLSYWFFPC